MADTVSRSQSSARRVHFESAVVLDLHQAERISPTMVLSRSTSQRSQWSQKSRHWVDAFMDESTLVIRQMLSTTS